MNKYLEHNIFIKYIIKYYLENPYKKENYCFLAPIPKIASGFTALNANLTNSKVRDRVRNLNCDKKKKEEF